MGIIIYCFARGHRPGQKMPPQKTYTRPFNGPPLYGSMGTERNYLYVYAFICDSTFIFFSSSGPDWKVAVRIGKSALLK